MCDQTEVSYLEDDVVWVKIGPIWWPGVVKDLEKDDEGKQILASLKKKPIAAVKFFQEDNYEFVKNLDHIYHYNCRRKDEFIKKGLDKFRTGASHMKKFPVDVTNAESLTNGDVNIINDPKFYPEKKESYSEIFGSGKKKSKKDSDVSPRGKSRPSANLTPYRPITHQRFINKVLHGESDHKVKTLIQCNSSSEDGVSRNPYKCHICKFETSRVNVIVAHHRLSHSPKNAVNWLGSDSKLIRRKPVQKSRKVKYKKLFDTSKDDDIDESDEEDSVKKKSPKNKNIKEKVKTPEKNKSEKSVSLPAKRKGKERSLSASEPKKKRFTDVLLADWDEDEEDDKKKSGGSDEKDNDEEDKEKKDENSSESVEQRETPVSPKARKNQNEKMSCFDFDEEEEGFIGMSNANTYGRKIPRVIPVKDKSELGMDLEIEELFKRKSESELETPEDQKATANAGDADNKEMSDVDSNEKKGKQSKDTPTPAKGPRKRSRSKASKDEEVKVNSEESLALRRARRPGARKSYLNEVIEKVVDDDVKTEDGKKEAKEVDEKTDTKPVREETSSSSRRKQDFKHHTLGSDREEIVYSEIVSSEQKTKPEPEKKKARSQNKDRRGQSEDLNAQIDSLLEETKPSSLPEISESSNDKGEKSEELKSTNFSFDYAPSEQTGKKSVKGTKELKSISKMFSESIPKPEGSSEVAEGSQGEVQTSESNDPSEEKASGDGQGKTSSKFSSINATNGQKKGSIVLSSVPGAGEAGVAKVKVLPVMRPGSAGKDCVLLPSGKKGKTGEESSDANSSETESLPKNIKAIKVKSDSLPPSLLTAGKLKGQTIIHQKGGKYVIVTQSLPPGRQKASPGKVQAGSKVVILTNQLGEQKIIKASGLQQTKFKVDGQKLVADSVTDKEATASTSNSAVAPTQPIIKMVPDGKGGIMKQLTVSPKKVLLGGTKVLVSGSGSTFSAGNNVQKIALSTTGGIARTGGGDYRLIENFKGSGKTVLIQGSSNAGSGVVLKPATGMPRQVTKVLQNPQAIPTLKKKPKILMRASTSQGEFVMQPAESPTYVVKQKGTDGKFSTQKFVRTDIVNQPKASLSGTGTKAFFISGQSASKKGESYIITTNESVPGKVIRMRQKVKEVDAASPNTQKVTQKNQELYTISQSNVLLPDETPTEAETPQIVQIQEQSQQPVLQTQVIAMPGPVGADGNQTYVLVSVDENGVVQGVDNSVVAYDASAQPESIFVNPTTSNNVILINSQANEEVAPVFSTSSQDILAEALANTNVLEGNITNEMDSVVPSILLPPSIPSSVVQETSITLQKPIMTPLEMPSSVTPDTSGLEPPPLPPTPTEEDVLMEDSEMSGGVMQEHQQKEGETRSADAMQYLESGNYESVKPTEPSFQLEDFSKEEGEQKMFEEGGGEEKKMTEYYNAERLNESIEGQGDQKEHSQEEFLMETSQEHSNSFQSLPVLNDEPDTSDDVQGTESVPEQPFEVDKSRSEQGHFAQLLREQEPPSSTNNEMTESHQELKFDNYHQSYESDIQGKGEPKSIEPETRIGEEQCDGAKEKETLGNKENQSLPIIADENNVNSYEMDPMYADVMSQKRFQEETEVSSTTDEFSNKDVTN